MTRRLGSPPISCPLAAARPPAPVLAIGLLLSAAMFTGCQRPPTRMAPPEHVVEVRSTDMSTRPDESVERGSGTATATDSRTRSGDASPKASADTPGERPGTPEGAIELAPGLIVDRTAREVRFTAHVCLREGWLEQLVCTPGTREHETIFVTTVTPSLIHAALLVLELEPGTPGSWRMDGDRIVEVAPTGPKLEALVRFAPLATPTDAPFEILADRPSDSDQEVVVPDADGDRQWTPGDTVALSSLVYDVTTDRALDAPHFRFAGSTINERENLPPEVPRYAADWSGSVVGLVTFGDEVIALPAVRPDQVDVAPAEWMAWSSRIPPLGTEVTIILRPR